MIDGAESLGPDDELSADICIVGAGPAGIAIALQFLDAGARVVMLEAGGRRPDRTSQELCRGEVVNEHLHPPADTYRRRGLGGSTSVWGGRCAPFDPQDFEPRPWLAAPSGWPIEYSALVPYWRRAHAVCELGTYDYAAGSAITGGMRPMFPGFVDGAVSTACIERFSRPTDFARTYGPALARSRCVRVLLGALCVNIILHPDLRTVRHLESLIVKIHQLAQVCRGAVVEIRSARRETAQDGSFHAIEVGAISCDEPLARIGGVEGFQLTLVERIRATGDQEHGQVRLAQFSHRRDDILIRLEAWV